MSWGRSAPGQRPSSSMLTLLPPRLPKLPKVNWRRRWRRRRWRWRPRFGYSPSDLRPSPGWGRHLRYFKRRMAGGKWIRPWLSNPLPNKRIHKRWRLGGQRIGSGQVRGRKLRGCFGGRKPYRRFGSWGGRDLLGEHSADYLATEASECPPEASGFDLSLVMAVYSSHCPEHP